MTEFGPAKIKVTLDTTEALRQAEDLERKLQERRPTSQGAYQYRSANEMFSYNPYSQHLNNLDRRNVRDARKLFDEQKRKQWAAMQRADEKWDNLLSQTRALRNNRAKRDQGGVLRAIRPILMGRAERFLGARRGLVGRGAQTLGGAFGRAGLGAAARGAGVAGLAYAAAAVGARVVPLGLRAGLEATGLAGTGLGDAGEALMEEIRQKFSFLENMIKGAYQAGKDTAAFGLGAARITGEAPSLETMGEVYNMTWKQRTVEGELKDKFNQFKRLEVAGALGTTLNRVFGDGANR